MSLNKYQTAGVFSFNQSPKEEKINSLTHAIMAGLLLLASPVAIWYTLQLKTTGSLKGVFGTFIFILGLIMMFTVSAVYHGLSPENHYKKLWKRLDHMAIFLTIACSYTPIALTVIGGKTGWLIFALEWVLVIAGVLFKAICFKINKTTWVISILLYLLMGWALVLCMPVFIANAQTVNVWLIIGGGLFYTLGIVFFAQKWRYAHVVWHGFVIAGAMSHYVAIVFFMH